jgi:hypothetical protein
MEEMTKKGEHTLQAWPRENLAHPQGLGSDSNALLRTQQLENELVELQKKYDWQSLELDQSKRKAKANEDNLAGLAGTLAEMEQKMGKQAEEARMRAQHGPQQPKMEEVEFEVRLDRGEDGIGVYFTEDPDTQRAVVDHRMPFYNRSDGAMSVAERSKQVNPGDVLLAVNDESTEGVDVHSIVDMLRAAPPGVITLRLCRPQLVAAESGGSGSGSSERGAADADGTHLNRRGSKSRKEELAGVQGQMLSFLKNLQSGQTTELADENRRLLEQVEQLGKSLRMESNSKALTAKKLNQSREAAARVKGERDVVEVANQKLLQQQQRFEVRIRDYEGALSAKETVLEC